MRYVPTPASGIHRSIEYVMVGTDEKIQLKGLNDTEIPALQQQYGPNSFQLKDQRNLLNILWDVVREPMFLLLLTAATLYFILGQSSEGFMMLIAMGIITAISIFQDLRSTKALEALEHYTAPMVKVIRNGKEQALPSEQLVPGDLLVLEEGDKIPADGLFISGNDFTVNESIITGESFPVAKQPIEKENTLYQGTTVNTGKAYAKVTATGNNTELGKLGKSVSSYSSGSTLLQQQVNKHVKRLAWFGISAFVLIWVVNYLKTGMVVESFLLGLTLAMAAIPEEIPVAFSSFMALGAYQMSRIGIISRQPQTIENLGAVTVICLDKTGTITENKMSVDIIYDSRSNSSFAPGQQPEGSTVLGYALLASELEPYDAMEIAIHEAFKISPNDFPYATLPQTGEYPLGGKPPMMTHVYGEGPRKIIAAKGAAERVFRVCQLDEVQKQKLNDIVNQQASKGLRMLAVASAVFEGEVLPASQDDFKWQFEGLVGLMDPPKKNVKGVFEQFYEAKINIKILTGDYPETVSNIAGQAGVHRPDQFITGDEIMKLNEAELTSTVQQYNIFARMFPDAKLRVVNNLKASGNIVAMTGDGVNDAPALKAADIGIAMGKRGTELARQVADLVVTDDNLERLVEAIRQGRKIFVNLKKSVRYIISIHIPIILVAALPLLLGWMYTNIFSPVHIIFLELIMGPTCSIFFEREPVEDNLMQLPPRTATTGLFTREELWVSIIQGLVITLGVLGLYWFSMQRGDDIGVTRALVFSTLLTGNIFLTFVNRSFTEHFMQTIKFRNSLAKWILPGSVLLLVLIHLVPSIRNIFGFVPIGMNDFLLSTAVAFVSIAWYELYKLIRYGHKPLAVQTDQ